MKKSVVIPWDKYQMLIGHEEQKSETPSYSAEKIITAIPQKMKPIGKALLEMLKDTNISWNYRGELVIDNQSFDGTNICDLLKSVLWNYKDYTPRGYHDFVKALASNNIPETLIQNTVCRSNMKDMKCDVKSKCWIDF